MRTYIMRCDVCNKVIEDLIAAPVDIKLYQKNKFILEAGDLCSEECADKWLAGLLVRYRLARSPKEMARRKRVARKLGINIEMEGKAT